LAVSPASSHNLFDGNEGLSAGEIDSGAATSCNDVTEACSTEEVTIELEHGHTQNDGDGDLVRDMSSVIYCLHYSLLSSI